MQAVVPIERLLDQTLAEFVLLRLLQDHAAETTSAQWGRTAKNWDVNTGPLARPFARSLAPLTHSLAPDCSLRSRPPLHSLVRLLAHFAHSLARGKVNY